MFIFKATVTYALLCITSFTSKPSAIQNGSPLILIMLLTQCILNKVSVFFDAFTFVAHTICAEVSFHSTPLYPHKLRHSNMHDFFPRIFGPCQKHKRLKVHIFEIYSRRVYYKKGQSSCQLFHKRFFLLLSLRRK